MDIKELKILLEQHNARHELIYHEKPIRTVKEGSKYFDINTIAPVFILKTDKGFFAFISAGIRGRINFHDLKEALNCKEVKLAERKEVKEVIGYEPGNIPLVGHNLPCIFDNMLLGNEFICGGSGDENHTLRINPEDLMKVNNIIAKVD
jgi:prolyl-tRNA editing enzyme YbaK/EbsC (Cys-tRNA(Pro) deacylase)